MIDEKQSPRETPGYPYEEEGIITSGSRHVTGERDVFGDEKDHQIKYKTLSWQLVAVLMIAEIVSNGMLSLPSSGGVVGVSHLSANIDTLSSNVSQQLVPNVILIVVRAGTDDNDNTLLMICSF
jgi:hypothetical protein